MEWDLRTWHCALGLTISAGIAKDLAWSLSKNAIHVHRRNFIWSALHPKRTVLWRLRSRKSLKLVLGTKLHMLHDFKPKRLRFGSEALTRLPTCISVPGGALCSHPLSRHGGGSAHKGKFDVTEVQVIASCQRSAMMRLMEKADFSCLRSPLLLK